LTVHPFLFVHPSDELYGADRMLLEMLAALPKEQPTEVWLPTDLVHPVAPLCAEIAALGITVRHVDLPVLRRAYRAPGALFALQRRCRAFARELRLVKAATVYCTTSATFLAAAVARHVGVPCVVGHVQEIWTRGDRRILAPLARHCERLVAISSPVAESLTPRLRARTSIVPNATPEPATRTPLDDHAGPLRFVIASRWNGWKGHRTLLAAWDRLTTSAQLVILGGPPPSGESVDVHAMVAGLRRPETVSVVGEVVDPSAFIDAADVVLVPSDQAEPFGLVAIEAFAMGRPVIGSAAGGLRDIITPQQDGWLFPPGDVDALVGLLSGLTRSEVTAAGSEARRTYEDRYKSESYAVRWRKAVFDQ
jgi:glycosyltransferase involved in cell wall biosynthesis